MLHIDVKKLGNVPDGGGWRYVGRVQGERNREATARRTGVRNHLYEPRVGTAFVHTVIDDHSRVAYAEICDDETAATAITVLRNAIAWFAERGVSVQRVLTDNGSAYKSHAWRDTCTELGITPKKTRPYRPQNQRQGRTLPPHPRRRLGTRPLLHLRNRTPQSPARLAASLQSPPPPHRHRRQTTHHQVDQRPWAVH